MFSLTYVSLILFYEILELKCNISRLHKIFDNIFYGRLRKVAHYIDRNKQFGANFTSIRLLVQPRAHTRFSHDTPNLSEIFAYCTKSRISPLSDWLGYPVFSHKTQHESLILISKNSFPAKMLIRGFGMKATIYCNTFLLYIKQRCLQ